jgi:hypothetical protein
VAVNLRDSIDTISIVSGFMLIEHASVLVVIELILEEEVDDVISIDVVVVEPILEEEVDDVISIDVVVVETVVVVVGSSHALPTPLPSSSSWSGL